MDFVISEASRNGIRLILSFVNNFKDYGGRPQYVEWARNAGVNVNGEDDFYTNPTMKEYYKNHVKVWEKNEYIIFHANMICFVSEIIRFFSNYMDGRKLLPG